MDKCYDIAMQSELSNDDEKTEMAVRRCKDQTHMHWCDSPSNGIAMKGVIDTISSMHHLHVTESSSNISSNKHDKRV